MDQVRDESGEEGTRHPNDPELARQQLAQSGLALNDEDGPRLIASIDRQIAEIDARKRAGRSQ